MTEAAHFSADWLRRREPFDAAARDAAAAALGLDDWSARLRRRFAGRPIEVVDLGCGLGANLRWLAPRIGVAQRWTVVDHDPALLAWAQPDSARVNGDDGWWPRVAPGGSGDSRSDVGSADLQWRGLIADLARRPLASLPGLPATVDLLTASALLDLVSDDWLAATIAAAEAWGADLLFALTADRRIDWSPADPDDAAVQALFAAHQRRDKGFGPALGADAAEAAVRRLTAAGWRCRHAPSDWQVPGGDPLYGALVDGTAAAAAEQQPDAAARIDGWRRRRHALAAGGGVRIGHVDLLAERASRRASG